MYWLRVIRIYDSEVTTDSTVIQKRYRNKSVNWHRSKNGSLTQTEGTVTSQIKLLLPCSDEFRAKYRDRV